MARAGPLQEREGGGGGGGGPRPGAPVWARVGRGADGCEAAVVQRAVGHGGRAQQRPHVRVAPVEHRVHAHEGWPARAAGAEHVLALRVGVAPARARRLGWPRADAMRNDDRRARSRPRQHTPMQCSGCIQADGRPETPCSAALTGANKRAAAPEPCQAWGAGGACASRARSP